MHGIAFTGTKGALLLSLVIVLLALKCHSFLILPHHHHHHHHHDYHAPHKRQPCIQNQFLLLAAERSNNNDTNNKDNDMRNVWNGVFQLWEEVLELSTYGPSERRMRKKARQEANARENQDDEDEYDALSFVNFQMALKNHVSSLSSSEVDDGVDDCNDPTMVNNKQNNVHFDGYALRDLLVTKWGVALDVEFQRGAAGDTCVYCTILPVAFGSRKCQHDTELAYLMHLQGVVEVLAKYQNLDLFVDFIVTTSKVPKPGTDSVPFRMELSDQDLNKILNKYELS